jgi:hypothetical protein
MLAAEYPDFASKTAFSIEQKANFEPLICREINGARWKSIRFPVSLPEEHSLRKTLARNCAVTR